MIVGDYDTFFNRHYSNCCGYIYKMVGSHEDAEELAGDAFMHVFKKWLEFENMEQLTGSLFFCAKNYALNHIKAEGRQKRGHTEELKPWMELDEVEVVEIEFYDIMCNSLHCLTPEKRQVFLMLLQGMTLNEVARALGLSYHTIKNHRINAIKSIQSFIKNKT